MDFIVCVESCDQSPNLKFIHPQILLQISFLLFCILHIVGPLSVLPQLLLTLLPRVFWLAPHFTQMVQHKDTCCWSYSANPCHRFNRIHCESCFGNIAGLISNPNIILCRNSEKVSKVIWRVAWTRFLPCWTTMLSFLPQLPSAFSSLVAKLFSSFLSFGISCEIEMSLCSHFSI